MHTQNTDGHLLNIHRTCRRLAKETKTELYGRQTERKNVENIATSRRHLVNNVANTLSIY